MASEWNRSVSFPRPGEPGEGVTEVPLATSSLISKQMRLTRITSRGCNGIGKAVKLMHRKLWEKAPGEASGWDRVARGAGRDSPLTVLSGPQIKKAFFALVANGIRAAPLWDSKKQSFVGEEGLGGRGGREGEKRDLQRADSGAEL